MAFCEKTTKMFIKCKTELSENNVKTKPLKMRCSKIIRQIIYEQKISTWLGAIWSITMWIVCITVNQSGLLQ